MAQPSPTPPNGRLVCLFFDDGLEVQYDVALPILLQHGFAASFAIITDYIGARASDPIYNCMTAEEIMELDEYGMDVAAHSKTHPNLTEISDEQLQDEIIGSKKDLEKLGFEVRTFVYPGGAYNERVIGYVKQAGYVCARSTWLEQYYYLNDADPDARFQVSCYSVSNQSLDVFKGWLSHSTEEQVVCLCYHFISDTGPTKTSTPVANFADQMRYLEETGFTVVLLPALFD
jgi:peptidoglycan/xylan/chitin deacetylase (PgdA/CDA1 family)